MKTTRAAKRACRNRGRAIAPCIAPLMKRSGSGHLNMCLVATLIEQQWRINTSEAFVLWSGQRVLSAYAGDADPHH